MQTREHWEEYLAEHMGELFSLTILTGHGIPKAPFREADGYDYLPLLKFLESVQQYGEEELLSVQNVPGWEILCKLLEYKHLVGGEHVSTSGTLQEE